MSTFFDNSPEMSPEDLAEALKRSLTDSLTASRWEPKVLGNTPDGGKIVSTHDWMRLRYENTEGWEPEAERETARREWQIARDVRAEMQAERLTGRNLQRKAAAAKKAAEVVAYVRTNPRAGGDSKTLYISDVAKACGVESPNTVRKALKQAGISI